MDNNIVVAFEKATGKTFESFKQGIFKKVDDALCAEGVVKPDTSDPDLLETIASVIQDEVAQALGVDYPQFNEMSSFLVDGYVDQDLD